MAVFDSTSSIPQPASGLKESTIWSPDPESGKQHVPEKGEDRRDVRGVISDVLVADNDDLYMRHLKLDFESGDDTGAGSASLLASRSARRHLVASRLLGDSRSVHLALEWLVESGQPGRFRPDPSYDDEQIFGFGRDKYPGGNTGQWRGGEKYHLFAYDRGEEPPREVIDRKGKKGKAPAKPTVAYRWANDVPLLATSLVATDDAVFIAGPPDEFSPIGEGEAALGLEDVEKPLWLPGAEKRAGFSTRHQWLTGKNWRKSSYRRRPCSMEVAAANGRLFLSLQDGSVVCLEGGGN